MRFEPGVSRTVELVALGGGQHVPGLRIRERELPTHVREPKKIVPFGTPGSEPDSPTNASPPARARVTEETARDDRDEQPHQQRTEEDR